LFLLVMCSTELPCMRNSNISLLATTPTPPRFSPSSYAAAHLSITYIAFIFSALSCTNHAARLEFATSLKITIRLPAVYTHASHNLYRRSSSQPITIALSLSSPLSRRSCNTERRDPE
jgi:hypothetical protein